MRKLIALGSLAVLAFSLASVAAAADKPATTPQLGKLRHVVLFKFKEGTAAEDVKKIEDAFRALPKKIPQVVAFEWGTDCNVEGLSQDFTHCFLVTFNDATARAIYLPHPAHKAFVAVLKPHLDKVLVIDYVVKD